ncbi:MAG: hypothetical protein N2Z72_01205 [Bacteroidales bacterium]|nr:hypothetical protein [Bacteroidales bacterium]
MKKIIFLLALIISFNTTFSQNDSSKNEDVIFYKFGADLTLGFYMYNQNIFFELIPGVTYFPVYWLGIGGGYYYQYSKIFFEQVIDDINVNGLRTMIRLHPIPQGCIHFEYRFMTYRTNIFNAPTYEYENIYCHAFIAGIGFTRSISERVYAHTLIMMDFLQNYKTPYTNPIIQTTFEYRFNLPTSKITKKSKRKK